MGVKMIVIQIHVHVVIYSKNVATCDKIIDFVFLG